MENLMSSQTLQVNGVFKNSELINHQPNKKVYSKPYLFCEKFVPQEFVAGCSPTNPHPGTYYISCSSQTIWIENNKDEGLQANNGEKGDFQVSSGTFWFNEQPTVQRINKSGGYYQITVTKNYKLFDSSGNNITSQNIDIISNHILYRNGSAPVISGPVEKNGS